MTILFGSLGTMIMAPTREREALPYGLKKWFFLAFQ
jgi:hypothetical protein